MLKPYVFQQGNIFGDGSLVEVKCIGDVEVNIPKGNKFKPMFYIF